MTQFLVRRFLWGVVTIFFIASLCFFITRLAPGSPFSNERQLTDEAMANLERYYGLDKPILVQYVNTMWAYVNLDFGPSYYNRDRTVSQLIWPGLRVSVMLGGIAFVMALAFGLLATRVIAADPMSGQTLTTVQIPSTVDDVLQSARVYLPNISDKTPVPLIVVLHSWSADYRQKGFIEPCLKECERRGWALRKAPATGGRWSRTPRSTWLTSLRPTCCIAKWRWRRSPPASTSIARSRSP